MGINLSILPHQTECFERINKVFDHVSIYQTNNMYANPIFDKNEEKLKDNIKEIQTDFHGTHIPKEYCSSNSDDFGIDIRMETGTGKTYCYTRLMYELNKNYGFHKFIILVPTTPIKEGTKSFIESDYARTHFTDLYPDKKISLSVLNAQKSSKGKKMFPQAISEFSRGTILEKNRINVLLMSSGMLLSKATMEREYDQTLFGTFSNPYDTLKATRPIVIIDEPHKFKRENTAYKKLIEKIEPLCVIRFGATFPDVGKTKQKDYNNLIFNLGSCEAFNQNLVKGVATQMIEQESLEETRVKLIDIQRSPKYCVLRNEKNKKTFQLSVGDSLAIIDKAFGGITIQGIGKTEDEEITKGVTLSNGQILKKNDQIYAGVYGNTYQDLMMLQAIKNHISQERDNFFRERKIKTLSLFFIDSIASYRGEEGESEGHLRRQFQKILEEELKKEYEQYAKSTSSKEKEYASFLESSIKDISNTNGGYFSEDNVSSDEEIQKEIDQILRDKQSLLSFKNEKGNWNIRRFIFSKWTLREGWDNPNVFQICKLRSSGSEISKLQEVGRGLRLPVDEYGNRIADEQFYLTYLYDYSEKDFASNLVKEINEDAHLQSYSIKPMLSNVAKDRGEEESKLFARLILNDYIDVDGKIILENKDKFMADYPEFHIGLQQNKVVDKNQQDIGSVCIREDKFEQIKELWRKLNQKYYLSLDEIEEEELLNAAFDILESNIEEKIIARTIEQRTENENGKLTLKEKVVDSYILNEYMSYGEFLKQIQKATGLPIHVTHKALCKYNKKCKLEKEFFNRRTLTKFIEKFQLWFENAYKKRYSYKNLNIDSMETSLTDVNGKPKKSIVQGVLGIFKDQNSEVPEKFLYDQIIYDSEKEKETIKNSQKDEIVVFGKIPRRSIRVPLYFGGTTSPDFMYVIKKDDEYEINLIIETKDVKSESSLRQNEQFKIDIAKKFFETMKENGVNVTFKKQLKSDDILTLIDDVLNNE